MATPIKFGRIINNCYIRSPKMIRFIHSSYFLNKEVRVRFAPSPTGHLHMGSLRTALLNFLFAKSQNGTFILRIEDTDQTRTIPGAVDRLIQTMSWTSIHPDEGPNIGGNYGPYIQSQRLHIYQDHIQILIKNGTAYRCFCTAKRLDLLRKEALRNREVPRYDGKCFHLTEKEIQHKLNTATGLPYVVRLKLSKVDEPFEDLVYGPVDIDITENEGDPILLKTDNYPTYHFANVVDDHLMKITHILRGLEWQTSTPKHLMLYKAFGWTPPKYAHLPLIMNKDGTKLSKRQGDIHVENFRDKGYYPESVLNYIIVSGGGFSKSDNEIMSLEEMIKHFDISQIRRNSGRLDPEHLDRINRMFLQRRISDGRQSELISQIRSMVHRKYSEKKTRNLQLDEVTDEYIKNILNWSQHRINRVENLVDCEYEYLWLKPDHIDLKDLNISDPIHIIKTCLECVKNIEQFEHINTAKLMRKAARETNVKFNIYMTFLRICLTGFKEGPSVGEIMEVLGRHRTIERLQHAIKLCEETLPQNNGSLPEVEKC